MIEAREAESESDADLLGRYQQLDDIAAYTELDLRYRADLVKQARRNLHRTLREDAEDVVQTALQKFHENRMTYAPQDVHALLRTLVSSGCKDHARRTRAAKRDYRKTFPLEDNQSADGLDGTHNGSFSDPKADPRKQETKMDVDAALAALTPEQAEAVRLDMAGHCHESAAEVTGISAEGQRRRLYSARRRIKAFLTPSIILLALIGSLADSVDADVYLNLVTAETDEDEVCREDGGHHDSDKQRRKSLMGWLIRPDVAKCCLALDQAHPSVHTKFKEAMLAVSVSPRLDRSWRDRGENGGVLHLRASKATGNRSPVPNVILAA